MKQVIVMRSDLNMSRGKLAAQACHASLGSFKKTEDSKLRKWEEEGEKKVVVKVNDLSTLYEIYEIAKKSDTATYLVKDAGHTELASSTVTCLGIGPDEDEKIDQLTGDLKLLK